MGPAIVPGGCDHPERGSGVFRSLAPVVWLWMATLAAVPGGVAADEGDVPPRAHRIEVREQGSGWPVPLVELETTHRKILVTDNAGVVAFDLPELMGVETWLHVRSPGHEVGRDGFGYRGVRLTPEPGGHTVIEVERTAIARRLGRLTGAGLFAESQKLGRERDWRESGVMGADTVQVAPYRGRLFWLWGDTHLPHYPLGIFHSSAATTVAGPLASLEPPVRMVFDYFRDPQSGRPREVGRMPGDGPTWITGLASVPDVDGIERLVGTYSKIEPPLDAYEWALCVWDDEAARFEPLRVIWRRDAEGVPAKPPALPTGPPALWVDDDGREWLLYGNPLPRLQAPATFEGLTDPGQWRELEPQESFRDAASGDEVRPHTGAIAWSADLERWVAVFMQWFGSPSVFGEIWYAEADSPFGPWGPAVKVLSHDAYTFYNPRMHPYLVPEGAGVILFEATYTEQFVGDPVVPTARHDYNQVLYRIDLDDPRLEPARQ